jgi:5-methyltetrahydrofolate--homocysteine methyltransferase
MTTSAFMDALASGRVLLMDGAMGTELQRAGLREGECAEAWNLARPEAVRAVHQSYVTAGARCLLTHTFQANPTALARSGLADRLEEITAAALALARSAAGPGCFVLGDLGPLPAGAEPAASARLAAALRGADGLLLETCSDEELLGGILRACGGMSGADPLPVLFSLTYRREPGGGYRTPDGMRPEQLAEKLSGSGIAALGVNCGAGVGMEGVIDIARRYRRVTRLPLFARPNAGSPTREHGRWTYPETPERMSARLDELLKAGVAMVGGCCGTTPEHIRAFRGVVDDWNRRRGRQ